MQRLAGSSLLLVPARRCCLDRRASSTPSCCQKHTFKGNYFNGPDLRRKQRCSHAASAAVTSVTSSSSWVLQLADQSFAAAVVYLGLWTVTVRACSGSLLVELRDGKQSDKFEHAGTGSGAKKELAYVQCNIRTSCSSLCRFACSLMGTQHPQPHPARQSKRGLLRYLANRQHEGAC